MAASSSDERRIAAIVILLGAALFLSAVLTWQAVVAGMYHRFAAQRAVRDFAAIATDELIRRAASSVESYGFQPMRQAIAAPLARGEAMPTLGKIHADRGVRLDDSLPLVKQIFMVDLNAHTVTPPVPKPLETWLLTRLLPAARERRSSGEPQSIRAGNHSLIAYGILQVDAGRIFGFLIDDAALGAFLQREFARRSIFPPSAGGGRVSNHDIFVSVSMNGRPLFRSPGSFHRDYGVAKVLGPEYGEVFRGATVESSVVPAAARWLVFGGVPQSHLPLYLAVLATTAGLVAAAAYLLHRERQLVRLRSDFISGVSHELRTPLTQIRMFAETLLLDRVRSEEEGRRSLEIIDQEARRLSHLVDNVLLFSRGERGAVQLHVAEHDASTLVHETIEQFMPVAAARNVEITTAVSSVSVRVDADAWKQVLINLLENAVKYGPAGQTVRVGALVRDGVFRMEVDDEGPGVPEKEREQIWEKFVRLERDRGTHKAGTGIGLAVVREIVSLHEGRCWVEDAPQRGSRFVVEVPR
ncbi:MAG TPA: HAMP domain-containing sensor histidine kinase [Thermoanaerobaculia bacterium]|jgi:signal transduction histidine kinase